MYNLNLTGCNNIEDVSSLGKVHTLNLNNCNKIKDVSKLKTVYELYLNSCQNITDVRELGNGCVHTLDIRWCKNITTDVSLLASIHNLEYIDIFSDQYDYEYEYLDQT